MSSVKSFASLLQNILMALVAKGFIKTVEGSSALCWGGESDENLLVVEQLPETVRQD